MKISILIISNNSIDLAYDPPPDRWIFKRGFDEATFYQKINNIVHQFINRPNTYKMHLLLAKNIEDIFRHYEQSNLIDYKDFP
jgi:hypothetical protein